MAVNWSAVGNQVAATIAALKTMESNLALTMREVQQLGFIARNFVERDITGATGRNFGAWLSAAAALRANLERVQEAGGSTGVAPARQAIATELPRLRVLRSYLHKAPEKVSKVPGAVLKPAQRTEFLRIVQEQVNALDALESQLVGIDAALSQAG